MAYNQLITIAIVALVLPTIAMASWYMVGGDDKGWTNTVNYTEWASDKTFYVGDQLVFKYVAPHNVYEVDGAHFNACNASGEGLKSGHDMIDLDKPGKRWFICGFGTHCADNNQKLVINVEAAGPSPQPAAGPPPQPAAGPPPPPAAPAPNAAHGLASSWSLMFVAGLIAAAAAML